MDHHTIMQGKRILVTGATSGIGEVTALELARMGGEVIVVSRSEERCRQTVQKIKTETGNQAVSYFTADLSSQAQIYHLAQQVKNAYDRLDVLVNNAGAFFWEREQSEEGIEMTFALNHLNYFLLTLLLLDLLKASPGARIVNVSSGAHHGQKLDFEDLNREEKYRSFPVYGQSKLANLYFTYELSRKLKDTSITVNALHPGFVATRFGRQGNFLVNGLMGLIQLFAVSPEKGAETSIYLASSPEVEGISGKYFVNKKLAKSSPESYDREAARRLWDISLEWTNLI